MSDFVTEFLSSPTLAPSQAEINQKLARALLSLAYAAQVSDDEVMRMNGEHAQHLVNELYPDLR